MRCDPWVSVKDSYPTKDGRYLVAFVPKTNRYIEWVDICRFTKDLYEIDHLDFGNEAKGKQGFYKYDSEYGYYEVHCVTHWMPLPEPPKEES